MRGRNHRYAADFNYLIELCNERNVAVQTIKSVIRRPWEDRPKRYNTYFYEPLENQESIDQTVHWSMGLSNSFVITAGDMQILPKMLKAAKKYEKQPSEKEMDALVDSYGIQRIFSY